MKGFQLRDFSGDNILPFSTSISPDGNKLAFTASTGPDDEDTHVFIINIDGTGLRQITDSRLGEWRVKWAKNGNGLFVVSGYKHLTEPVTTCIDQLYWVSENADKVALPSDDESDPNPAMVKRLVHINSNQSFWHVCAVDMLTEPWEL